MLDTCAAIWLGLGEQLSAESVQILHRTSQDGLAVYVSPMTAWEIGLLAAKGRLSLSMAPDRWWMTFVDRCGLTVADLESDLLISASFLPGAPPNDPADRIIAATARQNGFRLMTRDAWLLEYGAAGHLQTIPC